MTIDPPIITETYPQDLPNLFKGQQLIVVGRYQEPVPIELTFTGTAFGQPVEYNYSINLADTSSQALTFLPRLWAKRKMEHLFNEFYSLPPDSPDAMVLEDSTISISLCFGVISPFTSFDDNTNGGGGGATETTEISSDTNNNLILYPNPFRIGTTLQFETNETITEPIFIQIVNMAGTVIRSLEIAPLPNNRFEFKWDGLDAMGNEVPADVYIVKAIINGKVWIGKVVKI
jgi:Ca-activated chloride channel family protein